MPLNYRSLFEIASGADPVVLIRGQFRDWLRSMQSDSRSAVAECDWDGEGRHRMGDAAWMSESAHDAQDGSRLLRLTLDVTNATGRWITDVTAAERPGRESWTRFVWVETTSVDGDDGEGSDPKPPRLIRNLLAEVDGFNGRAQLGSRPYVVRGNSPKDVDDLVQVIEDDTRFVPVVVAGGLDDPAQESWVDVVAKLTRPGIGLLSAVVLDEGAVNMVNERLGPPYAVQHGGVRTFHRNVQIGDSPDSLRHRFITPQTMNRIVSRDSQDRLRVAPSIAHALAWNARRAVLDAGLPRSVRRVDTILRRESARTRVKAAPQISIADRLGRSGGSGSVERKLIVDESTQPSFADRELATPPSDVAEVANQALSDRLLGAVGMVFETEQVSDEHVDAFVQLVSALARDFPSLEAENAAYESLLDDAAQDSDNLREELAGAQALAAEAQLEAAIAEDERRRAEREAAWFRREAIEAQRLESLAGPTEPEAPKDLSALIDMITPTDEHRPFVTDRVVFVGVRSVTEELLRYDDHGRIAGAAWDVVLVLSDYAEAKLVGETKNIYAFLADPPPGRRTMSRHRFRSTESQTVTVNRSWRAERTFPVPTTVDASGEVFMDAHFELGRGDTVSPRLHLHDAVDLDGKVYIGYIGRHLTNTMS